MSYSVITIRPFDRQAKRLLKKYPSLKSELSDLITNLTINPTLGKDLGNNCQRNYQLLCVRGHGVPIEYL